MEDSPVPIHQGPLGALRGALVTGDFSDLLILYDIETFKAHRVIVCSQSPVLAAICSARGFNGQINLTVDDKEAVTKMIMFFYTGSYSTVDAGPTFSLFIHMRVYDLALKYKVPALLQLSTTRFGAALRQVSNLEVYFQAIHEVYSRPMPHMDQQEQSQSVQQPLRTEVVDAAIIELTKILSAPAVLARFQQVCTEIPQFHADFLKAINPKIEAGYSMGTGFGPGEENPPLCEDCGPSNTNYEIEIRCSECRKNCLHAFH